MPNYSGFEPARPFSSFIGGMGAANEMQYSALKSEAMRSAIDQQKEQRVAMKEYAATGEDTALKGVAPEMWMKMDEHKQKSFSAGMQEFQQLAPYLTIENYGAMHQQFSKRHPELGQAWPKPEEITDPSRLDQFRSRGVDFVTKSQANLVTAKGAAEVGVQKQQLEAITKPTMELQAKLQKDMAGVQYNNQKSLQENAQTFTGKQQELNRTLQTDLAKMTDSRAKADHFYNNLRQEEQGINTLYFKGLEALEKDYVENTSSPGYTQRREKLDSDRKKLMTDVHGKYSDWAKKAGVDFKPGQTAPAAGTKKVGPSPGTDPNFDRAKATIDAMPPGAAKEGKMKQLVDRWQSLQGKK